MDGKNNTVTTLNGAKKLTSEEKQIARICGITAKNLVFHGRTSWCDEYSLANEYFHVFGGFHGYDRAYIYRALLREFIAKAKAACGY